MDQEEIDSIGHVKHLILKYDLSPCPRCGGLDVEWTNYKRHTNVMVSYIACNHCELTTFAVESCGINNYLNLDYETTVIKYNYWVATNPKHYGGESWK